MSKVNINTSRLRFFNDKNTANPTTSVQASSSAADQANLVFTLPSAYPDSTKSLTVTDAGVMAYTAGGSISADGNVAADGAPGYLTGDSLTTVMTKTDNWIFNNFVDSPQQISGVVFTDHTTTEAVIEWDAPTVHEMAFIDATFPFINGFSVLVYKNDGASASFLGGSKTCASTAASATLAGTNTTFTSDLAVGDGIIITDSTAISNCSSTAGTSNLTGSGTTFTSQLTVGVYVTLGGEKRRIVSITNDTAAVVERNWISTTTSGSMTVSEERVVTAIASDTSLTVDHAFVHAITTDNAGGDKQSYESSPTVSQDTLFTTQAYLPREASATVVEAFRLYMSGGSNGQSGTTTLNSKNIYNNTTGSLANTDILKFEIYYVNYHKTSTAASHNKAYIHNIQFKQPGVPSAPQSLSLTPSITSLNTSWSAPADNDTNEAGNQNVPAIDQYKVTYSSSSLGSGVVRYGGATTIGSTEVTTASTSYNLTSLQAGQQYSVQVTAKNAINASYGAADGPDTDDLSTPTRPALFSTKSLDHSGWTTMANNGRLVSNNTLISGSDIVPTHQFAGDTMDYAAITGFVVNESNANLDSARHSFTCTLSGNSDDLPSSEFKAFDSSFPYASAGSTESGTYFDLLLSNHADAFNGDSTQTGYWATINAALKIKYAQLSAGTPQVTVAFAKKDNGTTLATLNDTFYVDDFPASTAATVSSVTNVAFSANTTQWVSGVPTRTAFTLQFTANLGNLGRYFVRESEFADMSMRYNAALLGSTTALNAADLTALNYSDASSVSSPLDLTKEVAFASTTLAYTDPGSGLHTTTSLPIVVRLTPKNMQGSGSNFDKYGINGLDQLDDISGKQLYVDTKSTRYFTTNYPSTPTNNAYSPTLQILTGSTSGDYDAAYPAITNSGEHAAYDHSISVSDGAAAYQACMQFVDARFRTSTNTIGYQAYSSDFLAPSGTAMPDYTGIATSGYRYVTMKFDISTGAAANINYVDVTLQNHNLSSAGTGVVSYFKMYMKVVQGGNYTPTSGNNTSHWVDCNAVLDGAVGRTQANYSTIGSPIAVLENGGSGNTTANVKRCMLVTGHPSSGTVILLRIGLDMSQDLYLGHVTLTCAAS
ncbi:fibronectin type III domain-containing protein [bacterium]|nr:fibronectin type III domain-containing protein [bacterium]